MNFMEKNSKRVLAKNIFSEKFIALYFKILRLEDFIVSSGPCCALELSNVVAMNFLHTHHQTRKHQFHTSCLAPIEGEDREQSQDDRLLTFHSQHKSSRGQEEDESKYIRSDTSKQDKKN